MKLPRRKSLPVKSTRRRVLYGSNGMLCQVCNTRLQHDQQYMIRNFPSPLCAACYDATEAELESESEEALQDQRERSQGHY